MQTVVTPDKRLLTALPYLKKGGCVADIGTDHAYLPIYLVNQGIVSRALAADINQGPIDSARANIAMAGLTKQIDTMQTDGLHGVERFAPDDIMIFGMGGELIVKILSEAPWIRREGIGLILQPMTRAAILRRWLIENGFSILGESLSFEDKYYQTVYARFAGTCDTYSEAELLLGRINIQTRPPLFEGFLNHEIKVLQAVIDGKSRSKHADVTAETRLLDDLKTILKR